MMVGKRNRAVVLAGAGPQKAAPYIRIRKPAGNTVLPSWKPLGGGADRIRVSIDILSDRRLAQR
jgi:hypothetical protein